MAQVLIRQLDDQVLAVLRARARCRGMSLEQSLRELLTAAAKAPGNDRTRLSDLRRQTPPAGRLLDVASVIREAREQR